MKTKFLPTILSLTLLFTLSTISIAQPPEWNPAPSSTSSMNLQGNVVIDGLTAATGDFIAAFSQTGALLGVAPIGETGGTAFFQLVVNGNDGTTSGLIDDGGYFILQVWDADAGPNGSFYEAGSPSLYGPFMGGNPPAQPATIDQIEGGVTTTWDNGFFTFVVTADNLLPIELTDFGVKPRSCDTYVLDWTTSSEINNEYFTLERSIDTPSRFEKIAEIDGAGTTYETKRYTYTDRLDLPGKHNIYYRLRQTDFDGQFSFSNIIVIEHQCAEQSGLDIYPNPIAASTTISVTDPSATDIAVYDVMGRVIAQFTDLDGQTELTIETSDWPAGTYVARLTNAAQSVTSTKLIKQD